MENHLEKTSVQVDFREVITAYLMVIEGISRIATVVFANKEKNAFYQPSITVVES